MHEINSTQFNQVTVSIQLKCTAHFRRLMERPFVMAWSKIMLLPNYLQ